MIKKSSLSFGIVLIFGFYIEKNFGLALSKNYSYSTDSDKKAVNLVDIPPSCDSEIFCYGNLLHTVSMSKIYADSKTFVDMSLKQSPTETLEKFNAFMKTNEYNPSVDAIKTFVNQYFNEKGKELIEWIPTDWKENPRFLDAIRHLAFRKWAQDLNGIWKILGRKMIDDIAKNPSHYSIIPVPNPVIVPGGRFLEFYYWDSYWVVRGLLYCEMYTTVRGILLNFLSMIDRFGFIPNGGRVYYLKRSQPPLLAPMIKSYVDVTGDDKFAIDNVKTLEREFQYYWSNYKHTVKNHELCSYFAYSSGPRPESYREDYELANSAFKTDEEKQEVYANLKAAAESGMDFSSRWFISTNGSDKVTLKDVKTRHIIAVELNSFLYRNAKIIAEFYAKAGNIAKSMEFEERALNLSKAIDAVLWNEEVGTWLDYDMINNKQRDFFIPTNLAPLWVKSYNVSNAQHISEKVLKYLNNTGVDKYPGGVPNTLNRSGEQWDFPNVWAPMQYMLIMGLNNLGTTEAKDLAEKWAIRWVQSNYAAFLDQGHMYEKYDAEKFGGHGGGGEYDVQTGFGWSNGVIIELLAKYGDKLKPAGNNGNNILEPTTITANFKSSPYTLFELIVVNKN